MPQILYCQLKMPHICICICTYKRPVFLKRLLEALGGQDTDGSFDYSIVVADNDRLRSSASVVDDFKSRSAIAVRYCVEPEQNIPRARNTAIANAEGEFIAFIDDDEFPVQRWLVSLFVTLRTHGAAGVLGPVKPYFDESPPRWIIQGKFYDRPTYPTGYVIDWKKGRTGNVLFRRDILEVGGEVFRPEFRTGEDQDLFRRLIEKGNVFVWCDEAVAYESVPRVRWKRSVMLRRALLRGASTLQHPTIGARDLATSFVAVPAYSAALPFALVLGQDKFMVILVKLCDHLGRLLALFGVDPVPEAYVTE